MLYIIRYIIMLSLLLTSYKFPELNIDKMLKLKAKTEMRTSEVPMLKLIDYPWAQNFNPTI